MVTNFHPFSGQTFILAGSIGSTDTSILLSSFLEPVTGTPYTMALLNTDIAYGTIAPKTTSSEFISFTGITANANGTATLTGVVRGLAKKYPFTTNASYKLPHSGQSQFIISDAPQLFEKYAVKSNDETIDGQWTFTNTPIIPGTVSDASTTVKGVSKLSVAPAVANNPIAYGANEPAIAYIPTAGQNAALAGSQGVVSATNLYETQDNIFNLDYDQSQTTQNSTQAVGEAAATTKADYLAQSFIPVKTKIRGVKLYKSADTGTFTGTVTVSLQADVTGSPSGVALATVTLTNLQYESQAVGAITVTFGTEYASMIQGNLYWIVIQTSTHDNSNHPNLGTNTAGGYASGSVKLWNVTDGWTAIANIDLYFYTLQGINSQVIKSTTAGLIPTNFLTTANLPVPVFQQLFATDMTTDGLADGNASGSNQDGSVLFVYEKATIFRRYVRDTNTGMYYLTHTVDPTIVLTGVYSSIIVIGSYVYVFASGVNVVCSRFSAADLTGEQVMTVPVLACAGGSITAWTDGTFAYVVSGNSNTTCNKWSLSGTTFSAVTTGACPSVVQNASQWYSSIFDGTYIYLVEYAKNSNYYVYKLADAMYSSASSTKTYPLPNINLSNINGACIAASIDTNRLYIGTFFGIFNQTAQYTVHQIISPYSKS